MLPTALWGQHLQSEGMSQLLGENVYPQDQSLGQLYVPEQNSRSGQEIFELASRFWNDVNVGRLEPGTLSLDGKLQIEEQLAPFLRKTPLLYRESLKDPDQQFEATTAEANPVPAAEATGQGSETNQGDEEADEKNGGAQPEDSGLPPVRYLQLRRVRVGNPRITGDYARLRCRLQVRGPESGETELRFIQTSMYFLREGGSWKVDVIDIDWNQLESSEPKVFGRGIYPGGR